MNSDPIIRDELISKYKNLSKKTNKYCQNSQKGTYCTCQKPFPDPDDQIKDSMLQCIICEDWYHQRCLFEEGREFVITDIKNVEDQKDTNGPENLKKTVKIINNSLLENLDRDTSELICKNCVMKFPILKNHYCLCTTSNSFNPKSSLIIDNSRRIEWSNCLSCQKLLDQYNLDFLYDFEDSIHFFETQQKQQVFNHAKQSLNLDAAKSLKMVQGFVDLRAGLTEFFKSRKRKIDRNQENQEEREIEQDIVTEEEVREFFKDFTNNKKTKYSDQNLINEV